MVNSVKFEILYKGPWLAWTKCGPGVFEVQQVVIDTMAVVAITTHDDGHTRIITADGVFKVLEPIEEVRRWVVAARRGLSHPDMLEASTVEVEEVRGD